MDLLNQNQNQKTKMSRTRKVILILLIVLILLTIGLIVAVIYLNANKLIEPTISINGENINVKNELIIKDDKGNRYISIKDLSEYLGYEYHKGGYGLIEEEISKCYVKNTKLISGFETDSNKIYKYEEQTFLDYQYYTINNDIITYNKKLYIALEDLPTGLNISYNYNEINNNITLNSIEYLEKEYTEKLKESDYKLAEDCNNKKALAYGWIIVNKNGVWGVIDSSFEEVIGVKYSDIYFDELNKEYIVANASKKYGIITTEGKLKQLQKFDEIKILNYENDLYKVKDNNKYGIIKGDGTNLTEIIYDQIGSAHEQTNETLDTLIIPKIYNNNEKTIVVKQNDKYGLIYLDTGKVYLPCDHLDKLYSISTSTGIQYKVEVERQTLDLEEYLRLRDMSNNL